MISLYDGQAIIFVNNTLVTRVTRELVRTIHPLLILPSDDNLARMITDIYFLGVQVIIDITQTVCVIVDGNIVWTQLLLLSEINEYVGNLLTTVSNIESFK